MSEISSGLLNHLSDKDRAAVLRSLFEVSHAGIVLIDQNHKVIDANESFMHMLGYSAAEITELHTWDWEKSMSADDIKENFADLSTIRTTFEAGCRNRRSNCGAFELQRNLQAG